MKLRSILLIAVAALFAASCSTSLQQRRVADELYQNPDQPVQQDNYMSYYDEAENILKEESGQAIDSVIYEEKSSSYSNPYEEILVDDYDVARQKRMDAMSSPSYGMSDWYDFYFSDAFHYASAYDPSFYNVIVLGDRVWVEPKWLTSHFGVGYRYGNFYNFPYNPFDFYSPYSGALSMSAIYGFNTRGYAGLSQYGYGYSAFGYNPYSYNPFGYSSYYSSYYGFSPFMNSYFSPYQSYNSYQYERLLQEEFQLNEEGRVAKYEGHSGRIRKSSSDEEAPKAAAFIRTSDPRKDSRNSRSLRDENTERYRTGTSQYVRSRKSSSSLSKPRYNRPHREANYERVRNERSSSYSNNSSGRKSNSVYRPRGNSSNRSVGSSSSGSVRKSGSGSSRSSGSSGSSGRKRK